MLHALSRYIVPGVGYLTDVLPPVPLTISPPGTGLLTFVALVARQRGAVSARSPYGLSLIPPDRPVAWTSRLHWVLHPRLLLGDPPLDAPEPFRGLLLLDRHPIEPPQPYTAQETRILCPICRVLEISRRTHQDGSLHRSRLLAVKIRDTSLDHRNHRQLQEPSRPPSLYFVRPVRTT
ncbi:hypothetical protein MTO96_036075 [Rhipicephalus appendiculatus]